MEGELSKSRRFLLSAEKVNDNDITVIKEYCIMDSKPIITCKYAKFCMLRVFYAHIRKRGCV